jgi:hypothetical protein
MVGRRGERLCRACGMSLSSNRTLRRRGWGLTRVKRVGGLPRALQMKGLKVLEQIMVRKGT